mmetsp:Transcript_18981/g.40214  ORF Transcript_18981/g.40214 Transcript_18981/m.40214 type:complete len:233 (-) Transcript_18981:155-853(-)
MLALEHLEKVLDDAVVEVLAAQVGVAGGGDHLEDAVVDGEERHVEGAAAQVEDEDVLLARLLVEAIGDGGGGGLVDDAHHVEARDGAGVLSRLALRVVEVGGDRDNGVLHLLGEELLGRLLHAAEHHSGDLLGRELLLGAVDLDLDDRLAVDIDNVERPQLHVVLHGGVRKTAADETLGVVHSVGRVERGLVLGRIADQALVVGEGDVRRCHTVTLVVGDDLHPTIFVHTHT